MSYRLLYVDDEADIREIAAMSLELDPDLEVKSCASGEEAITAAPGFKPDLILLDMMMPDMDGPATLLRLRELPETAETPVVFVTARAQSKDVDQLVRLGAKGVIAKPFDPMKLAAQARAFLSQ